MKNDLEQLQHQTEDKDSKYKEEISLWKNKIEESQQKSESMKDELHQIKAQHDELVAALKDLGVKVKNICNFLWNRLVIFGPLTYTLNFFLSHDFKRVGIWALDGVHCN